MLKPFGRFDAAQVEFEQAIRYKPDSAESHYNLGKLFSIQDNWEPARKSFEAALRVDPGYVEALDGLGLALEALGDDGAAVAAYEKAIALNDQRKGTFTSAHANLSAYYNRTGDAARALAYARQALVLDPRSGAEHPDGGRSGQPVDTTFANLATTYGIPVANRLKTPPIPLPTLRYKALPGDAMKYVWLKGGEAVDAASALYVGR